MSPEKQPEPQEPPEPKTPRHTPSPQHDNGNPQWRPFPWGEQDGDPVELPPFTG